MSSEYAARRVAPSALGDDARRFVNLTLTLARTDFKLRYFGSVLGYVWSLVRPLLLFAVLYVVFTQVFHAGRGVPHYPVYLLTSIILWTFFVETTSGSVQCLLLREGLLRKMRFPRLVIPLSVGLTALFNLGMNFIVVLGFALATGVEPRLGWLEMPVLVLLIAAFALGIGMLLSVLYVRFRDVQPIWDVVTQVLFYVSPIIYTAKTYPSSVLRPALVNPIAAILTQMNHVFIDPRTPSAATYIGGSARLLLPLGIIGAVGALGLWFFMREAPRIAENL
jgi:ABC-2 type transport system permease protein